jgi:DNA-binding MarR family transcriptional regulator
MDSASTGDKRLALCRTLILQRKLAKELLGAGLCANPIWDMLLELYVADRQAELLYIWQLSVSANIPISSAHRKIDIMVHKGFVERTVDESDLRRVGIQLASPFRGLIDELFDTLTHRLMTSCCQCDSGGEEHSGSD